MNVLSIVEENGVSSVPLANRSQMAVIDFKMRYLKKWKWQLSTHGYVVRNQWVKEKKISLTVFLHHCILGKPIDGKDVDHINCNPLDNRESNLRVVTHRENALNRKRRRDGNTTSRFPGIYFHSGEKRWIPRMQIDGKRVHFGSFKTEEEAIVAYERKREELCRK